MQKFKAINNEQLFLLPPSIEDFISSNHLARIVNEVVETIDVTEIEAKYSYLGQKSIIRIYCLRFCFTDIALVYVQAGRLRQPAKAIQHLCI